MAWIGLKHWMVWMLTAMHPFYISVVEIEHNAKDATIEISARTYTDDLEKMINKEYHVQIDLNDPKQKTKADALVKQYIQQKISLNTNGVKLNMDYVGFEIQSESTWSYFEIIFRFNKTQRFTGPSRIGFSISVSICIDSIWNDNRISI